MPPKQRNGVLRAPPHCEVVPNSRCSPASKSNPAPLATERWYRDRRRALVSPAPGDGGGRTHRRWQHEPRYRRLYTGNDRGQHWGLTAGGDQRPQVAGTMGDTLDYGLNVSGNGSILWLAGYDSDLKVSTSARP